MPASPQVPVLRATIQKGKVTWLGIDGKKWEAAKLHLEGKEVEITIQKRRNLRAPAERGNTMKTRNHNPLNCEAECPNCGTWQKVDRDEDGFPALKAETCQAEDCGRQLCQHCPQFRCTGCDLVHCAEHLTRYGTEELCILCLVLVIAEDKMDIGVIS